ncbi:MAG: hypothetical protein ACLQMH_18270, partial [Solirubrobacteraceae bacterium]
MPRGTRRLPPTRPCARSWRAPSLCPDKQTPRLRGRVTVGVLMIASTLIFAAVTLALAYVRVSVL